MLGQNEIASQKFPATKKERGIKLMG